MYLFSLTEGRTAYYPIISCKNMKVLNRDLLVIIINYLIN